MKKRFQLIALLAVALLGACSGGKDKVAVEQVDEKPRVKLADVKARPCPFYARRCLAWHVGIYKRNNRKNKLLKTHGYEERIYHLQTLRGYEECNPD